MHLAIFDLRHFEMVNMFYHLMKEDDQLTLFTGTDLARKFRNDNDDHSVQIVESSENSLTDSFIQDCLTAIDKNGIDLVIFNTIDRDYDWAWKLMKSLDVPCILTLHNVNTWLRPPFTLNRKALKNYAYRKKIVKRSSAFIVLDEPIRQYIHRNKLTRKEVLYAPYNFKQRRSEIIHSEVLSIAVPGAIDGHRRDHRLVLRLAQRIQDHQLPVEINLVGVALGPEGKAILDKTNELKRNGCPIHHFYEPNSNALFDRVMSRADVVLLPLNIHTNFEGIPEIYGTTKATGVVFDMMRFSTPGIVPNDLEVSGSMSNCTVTFETEEDIMKIILAFVKDPEYLNQLRSNAVKCSEEFEIPAIKSRLIPKLRSFVN